MSHSRINLWPDKDPHANLTLYPTERTRSRGGVLILPGGAYHGLADHEGPTIANYLSAAGFDCGVLRYRLGPDHRHPDMIHDAARGMRLMRNAPDICAEKIAILGFSAGGHLAGSLSVHHERFPCEEDDLRETVSARPDASILCYPVIDMSSEFAHSGSRNNLLGPEADPGLFDIFSLQKHVDEYTPPAFLWTTTEDKGVPSENSLMYAAACRKAGVSHELHMYERGRHGLGLAEGMPEVETWIDLAMLFMDRHLGITEPCN